MTRRTLRSMLGLRDRFPGAAWSVLTDAANEAEAELLAHLVAQQGIPVYLRRPPGHDDLLMAGVCQLVVPEERLAEGRELLESLEAAAAYMASDA